MLKQNSTSSWRIFLGLYYVDITNLFEKVFSPSNHPLVIKKLRDEPAVTNWNQSMVTVVFFVWLVAREGHEWRTKNGTGGVDDPFQMFIIYFLVSQNPLDNQSSPSDNQMRWKANRRLWYLLEWLRENYVPESAFCKKTPYDDGSPGMKDGAGMNRLKAGMLMMWLWSCSQQQCDPQSVFGDMTVVPSDCDAVQRQDVTQTNMETPSKYSTIVKCNAKQKQELTKLRLEDKLG